MSKPCDMDCFHCVHPDCINNDFWEIHQSERHNINSMIRAKRLKDSGLCVRCGKHPLYTGWVCKECAARMTELVAARRAARSKQGLCPRCGKVPLDPKFKMCAECREYFRRHNQDSRERRRIEQKRKTGSGLKGSSEPVTLQREKDWKSYWLSGNSELRQVSITA